MMMTMFVGISAQAEETPALTNDVLSMTVKYNGEGGAPQADQDLVQFMMQGETLDYTLQPGDKFEYDIKVVQKVDNVPLSTIFLQYGNNGGAYDQYSMAAGLKDQNDVGTDYRDGDMSLADNKWYHRSIDLAKLMENDTTVELNTWWIGTKLIELKATTGTAVIYYDNIRIVNNGVVQKVLFEDAADMANNPILLQAKSAPVDSAELKVIKADAAPSAADTSDDYMQLDVNTAANTANNSRYRLGSISFPGVPAYQIAEGDYVEYDVKLLNKVAGIGGIDFNVVFENDAAAQAGTQINWLLSQYDGLGYEGAAVDLTGKPEGEWSTVKFDLKKTGAYVDTALLTVHVAAGAMEGTASVQYDNIVIKDKDGNVKRLIFKNYNNRLTNQEAGNRCEAYSKDGETTIADCQLYLVRNVKTAKDAAVSVSFNKKDERRIDIGYTVSANPAHGTLTAAGNVLTYTPAEGYTGADTARVDLTLDHSGIDFNDWKNSTKVILNFDVQGDTPPTTEPTEKPIEKKTIEYIHLDANTKKGEANTSIYRLGDLGGYEIVEGDYIEYDLKLLDNVKGLGGIDINVVHETKADMEAQKPQKNAWLSTYGYKGADVDATDSVGKWKTVSFKLEKTGAILDAIVLKNNVKANSTEGTASVLYDNIRIKDKDGKVKVVVFEDYMNRIKNQDAINRCIVLDGGSSDCQAYVVRTMYVDKNGTTDMDFIKTDAFLSKDIGYKVLGDVKHGKLSVSGNKVTYTADKDYVGMDYATLECVFDYKGWVAEAEVPTYQNLMKLKLNIAVAVDPEKEDTDKPVTGDTMPLVAMAMLLPTSLAAIVAVKKGKKK